MVRHLTYPLGNGRLALHIGHTVETPEQGRFGRALRNFTPRVDYPTRSDNPKGNPFRRAPINDESITAATARLLDRKGAEWASYTPGLKIIDAPEGSFEVVKEPKQLK